jgi:hypothetical protein
MTTGSGASHRNIRGRDARMSKDLELAQWVLSEYMAGKTISQITKDIIVKFPDKPPVSRITLSRFINQHLDDLDIEESHSDQSTKELLNAFQETKNSFNDLFDKIREEVDLTPEQVRMIDTMQRRCNINLNTCKTKWKLFIIATKQANTELKELLSSFTRSLDSSQKQKLSEMVDKMFDSDELLSEKDRKKYQKYQAKKVELYFKMFPQHENSEVQ